MSQRKPTYLKNPKIELKAIKYYADYQLAWNMLIPRLREYSIQKISVSAHFAGRRLVMKSETRLAAGGSMFANTAIT